MFWPQENCFFVGAFNLDAVSLDGGIILESVMNDAAIKGIQGFQLHDITPAADLFSGFLGLLNEGITLLGAVIADIESYLGTLRIFFEDEAVGDVLEFAEGLALAPDQTSRI